MSLVGTRSDLVIIMTERLRSFCTVSSRQFLDSKGSLFCLTTIDCHFLSAALSYNSAYCADYPHAWQSG